MSNLGETMRGLMMDFPLTIPTILRRAESFFGHKQVVTRLPDRSIVRRPYADVIDRAKRLAVALTELGVRPGDRVATLGLEHAASSRGVSRDSVDRRPCCTRLNLRLHCDDISYIVNDAEDQVLLLDASTLPIYEQFKARVKIRKAIVMAPAPGDHGADLLDYETLVAAADPARYVEPRLDEQRRRGDVLHVGHDRAAQGRALFAPRADAPLAGAGRARLPRRLRADVVLPVVPMFHVNAWGLPFTCTMVGATQVFPGPFLDPDSLLELLVSERVTVTAGVPTVWMGAAAGARQEPRQVRPESPERDRLRRQRRVAGADSRPAGAPRPVAAACLGHDRDDAARHGLLGSFVPRGRAVRGAAAHTARGKGVPQALVEIRARTDEGFAPWDGKTMGELEVRGPWVAASYYNSQGPDDRFTKDGWFRTGDIVTIGERGCIELTDRAKDLVKSGGEWISTVALETALMGHPAVAEAAVIAVPHPKWDERPLAVVVLKPGQTATADDLRAYLAPNFAKWWLPDAIEFAKEIPRTSVGKFKKTTLREQYRDHYQTV